MIEGVKTKNLKVIPDEQRLDPYDNDIPYDWRWKDG
jgi:hypothetical protein